MSIVLATNPCYGWLILQGSVGVLFFPNGNKQMYIIMTKLTLTNIHHYCTGCIPTVKRPWCNHKPHGRCLLYHPYWWYHHGTLLLVAVDTCYFWMNRKTHPNFGWLPRTVRHAYTLVLLNYQTWSASIHIPHLFPHLSSLFLWLPYHQPIWTMSHTHDWVG